MPMNNNNYQPETSTREGVSLEWEAPVRPFKEHGKVWFKTIAVIVVLVSLVAIFLKEFLLLGVVFALAFVSYVLSTNPPQMVRHKIGSEGVLFGEKLYPWDDLSDFYFKSLDGEKALFVATKKRFPSLLILLLSSVSEEEIKTVLKRRLNLKAAPQEDWMEKSARWLSSKVGLD